jgi:hypothetical protein
MNRVPFLLSFAIGALQNKCYILLSSNNSLKPTSVKIGRFLLTY